MGKLTKQLAYMLKACTVQMNSTFGEIPATSVRNRDAALTQIKKMYKQ